MYGGDEWLRAIILGDVARHRRGARECPRHRGQSFLCRHDHFRRSRCCRRDQFCRPSRASIIAQGTNVTDNRFNWSFDRLLTPTLAFTLDSGWIHQNWPLARSSGFDSTAVGLKTEIYRDNRHEALASAGLQWGIGHSGAAGVEADEPNTVQPGVFFGKGFGDVPASVAWLRPFAVTGAVVYEIPAGGTGATALAPTPSGLLQTVSNPKVDTLHWGLSIQYSTYYLTSRFTGGPPKDEPLNQLVPLVEFAVDNPRTGASVATMNPGFAYVAVTSANRRRSRPAAEPGGRELRRVSRATAFLHRRHVSGGVWQAGHYRSAGSKPHRLALKIAASGSARALRRPTRKARQLKSNAAAA